MPALSDRVEKAYRRGTHRACPPEDTLERVTPSLADAGITRVANVTGLDHLGIPVVMVCRPNSRSISVSQGKGLELLDAKASGVMEAIELFHGENVDRPLLCRSYTELRRQARVADVRGLPLRNDRRFHSSRRLPWIEGFDLLNTEPVWVPYALTHTDFRLSCLEGGDCFLQSSNGLASGNHILEALVHGISEIVERDAVTLWELNSRRQREASRVRLETIEDPSCRHVLQTYKKAGIAVAVWNATSDIGVPAFACYIVPDYDDPFRRLYATCGFGAHPSRNIALLRALLEAAQSRLTIIAGARDDIPRNVYLHDRSLRVLKQIRAQIQAPDCGMSFVDAPSFEGPTVNEDLDFLLGRLRSAGIRQVIAIDLSKPELGIPVARVVIPYLETARFSKYRPGPRAQAKLANAT